MSQLSILCIDDEKPILTALESELYREFKDHFLFEFADNSLDGLEIVKEIIKEGEELAVVITDYLMPRMRGDQLLIKIHELSPKTLKILLTGQADVKAVANIVNNANLLRYIIKPWEPKELTSIVRSAFQSYLKDQEIEDKNKKIKHQNQELLQAKSELEKLNFSLEEKVEERTKKLKQRQSQLIHSEKMASLGTLVAGIAHEFNNPLSFLQMGLESMKHEVLMFKELIDYLLSEDPEPTVVEEFNKRVEQIMKTFESVQEGNKRIQLIIKDLRTFSRLGEAEKKVINVIESLKSTLRLLQSQHEKRVQFIEDYHDEPEIECWPAQLNQVFLNVIRNACQAIEEKQKKNSDPTLGQLHIKSFNQQDYLIIQFYDTGEGMTKEVQMKIFEPFFTTKDVGVGTGLGMSVSYGIMEKHHGNIEVESEQNRGTTISLRLPINNNQ